MTKDIILLHGWGGSKDSLKSLAYTLHEKGFKTNILEMPGHGRTPEMKKPWDMKDFAEWTNSKIKKLGIKKYILLGHSFGGKIIFEGLKSKTLDPSAILLIDVNGVKPRNTIKRVFWKLISSIGKIFSKLPFYENIREFVYRYLIRERDYVNTNSNMKKSFQLFNNQHYNDFVKKVKVPTLIVWGKDDKVTPIWMGEFLNKEIKHSRFVALKGTHGLPIKSPEEVGTVINEFLKNI